MNAPVGVLLANLGTPDAPTPQAVRRYLREFLSDPRVVDVPRVLWWPILYGVILRRRPKRSAALYRNVWTAEGSPLLVTSERVRAGVAARLGDGFVVEIGMRYGRPGIGPALTRLLAAGCTDVTVVPMFPQCSSATTGSVFDAVVAWARRRRNLPSITFVRGFADHPGWIRAVAAEVRRAGVRPTPQAPLLVSFHGVPVRFVTEGDPYARECEKTARALARELDLSEDTWRITFQSKFGREEWLRPYTFDTLASLPKAGVRSVSVVSPAFVADCLETIDEIGREGKRLFEESGGSRFVRIACPNASVEAVEAIADVVRAHVPRRAVEAACETAD